MATIALTSDQRSNLLCSAIEGGSNYWYWLSSKAMKVINEVKPSDGKTPLVDRMWAAIEAGKSIPIHDLEDTKVQLGEISLVSIERGEQTMIEKHIQHFADVLKENDDAATGDVWFQLAVMNEVVYG